MTPRERAEKTAAAMLEKDQATRFLGMEIERVDEGCAVLTLVVQPHHCNGHFTCHGGVSFSLADSAFAFACNSRNQATVGQQASINYTAPAKAGDILRAQATEVNLTGRSGVYDVRVTKQDGAVIAEFRGMSRTIGGTHFEE